MQHTICNQLFVIVHFSIAVSATAVLIRSILCNPYTFTMYQNVAWQCTPPPGSKVSRKQKCRKWFLGYQKNQGWIQAQINSSSCIPSPPRNWKLDSRSTWYWTWVMCPLPVPPPKWKVGFRVRSTFDLGHVLFGSKQHWPTQHVGWYTPPPPPGPGQGQVKSRWGQGQVRSRSGQGARMDGSDLTMIIVDLIYMADYPAESCAVSPTAFSLYLQEAITVFDWLCGRQEVVLIGYNATRFHAARYGEPTWGVDLTSHTSATSCSKLKSVMGKVCIFKMIHFH